MIHLHFPMEDDQIFLYFTWPYFGHFEIFLNQDLKSWISLVDIYLYFQFIFLFWSGVFFFSSFVIQIACFVIKVYDGDDESDNRLARLCGESIPAAVLSSGNSMLVNFISDFSEQGEGFRAQYQFGEYRRP